MFIISPYFSFSMFWQKTKQLVITDIYSVDLIIYDNMEWKKLVKREHKDLEKIMKRELNLFRNKDIDFYNILESNYEDLKYSLFKNDSLSQRS